MLFSAYYLKDSLTRLNNLQSQFEKQIRKPSADFKLDVKILNVQDAVADLKNAIMEISYSYDKNNKAVSMASTTKSMMPIIEEKLEEAKTEEEFLDAIQIVNQLWKDVDPRSFEYIDIGRFDYEIYAYDRSACVSPQIMQYIYNALKIHNGQRTIKLLQVPTRTGKNATYLNDAKKHTANPKNIDIYGIDTAQVLSTYSDKTKSAYKRIIYGPLRGSNISNDAFDIALVLPKLSETDNNMKLITREEKDTLQRTTQYLRYGGTMIFGIPRFRFYKDMCLFLLKNFEYICFIEDTFDKFTKAIDMVYFIGIRKKNGSKNVDKSLYYQIRHLYDKDNDLIVPTDSLTINVPRDEKDVVLFRGSVINDDELNDLYARSSSTSQFWEQEFINNLGHQDRHPLLPFNVGQIGLVLTSGCLDGVVEEGDGHCHVVKGRVVHKTDTDRSTIGKDDTVEVVETSSNRVEINVFLPDGTYKKLA